MQEYKSIRGEYRSDIQVAVLCIFFNRPECFAKSFAAVRRARPSKLLLWQDGPRENCPDDIEGIRRCREIAGDIDWDCDVYTFYHEKNYGCDPSTFYSHKWAFSLVDKCIVLEDDVVPDPSFFSFCKEMLDRYENDLRINRICGMNNVPGFSCPDSYFFSSVGAVWGWATWKRVADLWDEEYSFLNDYYNLHLLRSLKNTTADRNYFQTCLRHAREGVPHWETIQTYARHMNSQLNIVPSVTLIKNVGLGERSAHSNIPFECVPKQLQEAFYGDCYEMEFPLRHPKYVMDNVLYKKQLYAITGRGNPWKRGARRIVGVCRRIANGDIRRLINSLVRKLRGK